MEPPSADKRLIYSKIINQTCLTDEPYQPIVTPGITKTPRPDPFQVSLSFRTSCPHATTHNNLRADYIKTIESVSIVLVRTTKFCSIARLSCFGMHICYKVISGQCMTNAHGVRFFGYSIVHMSR